MGGCRRINKVPYRVWVKQSIHTESLFPKYLNYYYILTYFFNYSSFTLPNVLWAKFFSDEITCERFLLLENFAMDVLRVAGTDGKEMKLGLIEDTFYFIFDGVWQKFALKLKLAQAQKPTEVFWDIFLSEVVFWWDVDPYHVLTFVSLLDYLPSMPR